MNRQRLVGRQDITSTRLCLSNCSVSQWEQKEARLISSIVSHSPPPSPPPLAPPPLQDSLSTCYSPSQQVMLLSLLADLGGRPPQGWLAAHEAALLAGNAAGGGQALGLEGWLLLLQGYSKLMYK